MTDEFDPTLEGMERYKKTNMSKSAYFQMRNRWLQQQARREGYKGSMLSYVPRGYNRAYTMSSAEKNKQYWKPEAVARTDFQAPWAVRRADKPAYWDDPKRVGMWYDFLRLQSDDYEPPDWLDKDEVTTLYKELKNFNGNDDYDSWKPLPVGSMGAYYANFAGAPEGYGEPIYTRTDTLYKKRLPTVFANIQKSTDEFNAIQKKIEAGETLSYQEYQKSYDALANYNLTMEQIKTIDPEMFDQLGGTIDFSQPMSEADYTALINASVKPELPDYNKLEPWQQFVLPLMSQGAFKNRPEGNAKAADIISAVMSGVGTSGAAVAGISFAATAAVAAGLAIPTGGLSMLLPVVGATLFGIIAKAQYDAAVSGTPNKVLDKAGKVLNWLGEQTEIGVGLALNETGSRRLPDGTYVLADGTVLNKPGEKLDANDLLLLKEANGDWNAAKRAASMFYESRSDSIGNFLLNAVSWTAEALDKLGITKNAGTGQYAGKGETWMLSKGLSAPQVVEYQDAEALSRIQSEISALGKDATRDEVDAILLKWREKFGDSGNISDFTGQMFLDVSNFIPMAMNAGLGKAAKPLAKSFAAKAYSALDDFNTGKDLGGLARAQDLMQKSQLWDNVDGLAKSAIGNPITDAMPMGVQRVFEGIMTSKKLSNLITAIAKDPDAGAAFSKYWRGTKSPYELITAAKAGVDIVGFQNKAVNALNISIKKADGTEFAAAKIDWDYLHDSGDTKNLKLVGDDGTEYYISYKTEAVDRIVKDGSDVALTEALKTNILTELQANSYDYIKRVSIDTTTKEFADSFKVASAAKLPSYLKDTGVGKWLVNMSSWTPESRVKMSMRNLQQALGNIMTFAGGDKKRFVELLQAIGNRQDVSKISEAARQFQDGALYGRTAVMIKDFVKEGGTLEGIKILIDNSSEKTLSFNTIAKAIAKTPLQMRDMLPEDVYKMLTSTNPEMANTLSLDMVTDIMKPFIDKKNPMPLTEGEWVAKVALAALDTSQDMLIREYGVTKMGAITRFSKILKKALGFGVITASIPTWVTNFLNNQVAINLLIGEGTSQRRSKIKKFMNDIGVNAEGIAGKEYGLSGEIEANSQAIYRTLHPPKAAGVGALNALNAFQKHLGKFGEIYGNIESSARMRGFYAAAKQYITRWEFSRIPETIRSKMSQFMTEPEIRALELRAGSSLNTKQLREVFGAEITHHPFVMESIDAAIDNVTKSSPELKLVIQDTLDKTPVGEYLRNELPKAKTAEDVEAIRWKAKDLAMQFVHAQLADDITLKITNINDNPEGLIYLLDIFQEDGEVLYYSMIENSLMYGDVTERASAYRKAGQNDLADMTIRLARESSDRRFQSLYTMRAAVIDAAIKKAGHGEVADRMAVLMRESWDNDKNFYKSKYSIEDNDGKVSTRSDRARIKKELKALTRVWRDTQEMKFKEMCSLWVELVAQTGESVNGLNTKKLHANANAFIKGVISERRQLRFAIDKHYGNRIQTKNARHKSDAYFYSYVYQPMVADLRAKYTQDFYNRFFKIIKTAEGEVGVDVRPITDRPIPGVDARDTRIQAFSARVVMEQAAEDGMKTVRKAAEQAMTDQPVQLAFSFIDRPKQILKSLEEIDALLKKGEYTDAELAEVIDTIYDIRQATTITEDAKSFTDVLLEKIDDIVVDKAGDEPELPPITEYPLGSVPEGRMDSLGMMELAQHPIDNTVDAIFDEFSKTLGQQQEYTFKLPDVLATDPDMKRLMGQWENEVETRTAMAVDYGKMMMDNALLDYTTRTGADDLLDNIFPYHFWTTRSIAEWAKRVVTEPSLAITYAKYKQMLQRNDLELPARFAGKLRILARWLPDYMGDALYIDPLAKMFPLVSLIQPIANLADLSGDMQDQVISRINAMVRAKLVSEEAGLQAIREGGGEIWKAATAEVIATNSDIVDPLSAMSWSMQAAPWFTIPYYLLKGQKEKITSFPMARQGRALAAQGKSVGGAFGGILEAVGNIIALPEDTARKIAGLSPYDLVGDYYIEYWLSNMATEEGRDTNAIIRAMNEKQGELWDEAKNRADEYLSYRMPGSTLIRAVASGDPRSWAAGLLMTAFPAGLYPEGEMKQRGLSSTYQKAWLDFTLGNNKALTEFYAENPEYEARLALFKPAEERMKSHLINIFWDKYYSLPDANKQMVNEQLGETFEAYMLDPDTRDYDKLDIDTLTYWNRQLGNEVPKTKDNEYATTRAVEPLEYYGADIAAAAQEYIDLRKQMFPNYWWQQNLYYALPEEERQKYAQNYTEYKEYLDWNKKYKEDNPIVAEWLKDRAGRYNQSDLTEYNIVTEQIPEEALFELDGEMMTSIGLYIIVGTPLPSGAKAELNRLWTFYGKPGGSLETWIDAYLGLPNNE